MTATKPLTDMTVDELKELKREWYREARDSGKLKVIATVARVMGQQMAAKYGPKYQWQHGDISIYLDDYGRYLTVTVDETRVCSTHPTSCLFVPGDWYDVIAAHAPNTDAIISRREQSIAERERQRLLAELGVTA